MGKTFRIGLGSILVAAGVIFFILPGSILFLLGGLLMLSYDVPRAREWLRGLSEQYVGWRAKIRPIYASQKTEIASKKAVI